MSQKNRYIEQTIEAYNSGIINKYMFDKILSAIDDNIDDVVYGDIEQDAIDASSFGIDNDNDYSVYFFVGHLADDILEDTFGISIDPEEKVKLKKYILSNNRGYKFDNLTDYRILIHKWLCDKILKKAYPNIAGKQEREPIQDLDKWISTLKSVYSLINSEAMTRQKAIELITENWDLDEVRKFVSWMRYYEEGNTEKYNVKNAKLKKESFEPNISLPSSWVSSQNREEQQQQGINMSTYKSPERTKREKELEMAMEFKRKMRSRLLSLKRLLDKYNDVLPQQNLESIFDEMHRLEKSISRLNAYATMQDCVIRSANRIEKFGFSEGADYLIKAAEEPVPPATPVKEDPTAVGEDVVESIPEPVSNEPNLQEEPKFTVMTIIDRLEGVSKALKSRDMIRELASIDILLNEMGMASFFPELTDAQSKLIESFGYASNKIEAIVAKLRGSGTSKPNTSSKPDTPNKQPIMPAQPQQPPVKEKIDTGEIATKPVGEVKTEIK